MRAITWTSRPGPATTASARATIGSSTGAGRSSWPPRDGRRCKAQGHQVPPALTCAVHQSSCYTLEQPRDHHSPRLLIEAASSCATTVQGQWLVAWRVQNLGQEPCTVLSTWLPHDKFASHQTTIDPPLRLLPGESTRLELPVTCHEPPGSVVDNAFLILRLLWLAQSWRAFARHRVVLDDTGTPQPVCQVVTIQRVGFSARSGPGPGQPK